LRRAPDPASIARRRLIIGAAAALAPVPAFASEASKKFAELEARHGGRLGVSVLDMETNQGYGNRADEPFPMCSTFKTLAVSAVLQRVDRGKDRLDRIIRFGVADLQEYAPVARKNVGRGGMTLGELCEAAMVWSDNTAANLLLTSVGGPIAVTGFVRSLGDSQTRVDRFEPENNSCTPGDPRDTTTPRMMLADFRQLLFGSMLSNPSRDKLYGWATSSKTGLDKLRAGVPSTSASPTRRAQALTRPATTSPS
jgi:beta-lactamase class A